MRNNRVWPTSDQLASRLPALLDPDHGGIPMSLVGICEALGALFQCGQPVPSKLAVKAIQVYRRTLGIKGKTLPYVHGHNVYRITREFDASHVYGLDRLHVIAEYSLTERKLFRSMRDGARKNSKNWLIASDLVEHFAGILRVAIALEENDSEFVALVANELLYA